MIYITLKNVIFPLIATLAVAIAEISILLLIIGAGVTMMFAAVGLRISIGEKIARLISRAIGWIIKKIVQAIAWTIKKGVQFIPNIFKYVRDELHRKGANILLANFLAALVVLFLIIIVI